MHDEMLQDFLIEAGEMVEALDGQLVGLEHSPGDMGVLNGVFRTFHTVKGGAGFLGLKPLVTVCHNAEELLNAVRSGARPLDAEIIDAVLGALDEVRRMFDEIRTGAAPSQPTGNVLTALEALLTSPGASPAVAMVAAPVVAAQASRPDAIEAVFEQILAARAAANANIVPPAAAGDTITEDEFEALIDRRQNQAQVTSPAQSDIDFDGTSVRDSAVSAQQPAAAASLAPVAAAGGSAAACAVANAGATLRVASARIDGIMNQVSELVLVSNRLAALTARIRDEEVHHALAQLHILTSDLQTMMMGLRMQSVSKIFGRFTRVARDLARQLGKQVELVMEGETIELDKAMLESLVDPLVHLVRNAVDHGIEMPVVREAAGKSPVGRIVLAAGQDGSHIIISVSDDGAGIDPERLRSKAVEKGLVDTQTALQMPEEEILKLIFFAGFSTRDTVSEVSGRGVGMDVVKSQITLANGTVQLQSESGLGSRVVIRIPLTLAILPTLMFVVDGRRFALPLPVVEEILDLAPADRTVMDEREVLSRRGEVMPLLDLYSWLKVDSAPPQTGQSVIVVSAGERRVALVVDGLLGQEKVVIKSLGQRLQALPGFAGATITGDGDIALIIDVASLYDNWCKLTSSTDG
jgi:two-component system chemotaxis sensor kinase CheA